MSFKSLASFNVANGAGPYLMALIQGTDGNLYGTTSSSGANGYGTVFKITPAGTPTTLYSFCSQFNGMFCTDGSRPYAGLVLATDGNFYGTTWSGGAAGAGTVFKITAGGTLTTLYSFCAETGCTDGKNPQAALVQATDGNFYGTTRYGGSAGLGTVFKITAGGKLTTLHSFIGAPSAYPPAGLVQATNGNFYGTTEGGGYSEGTVFEITPSGKVTTLYSFCSQKNCADGEDPIAGLVQATNGNLYGTTYAGGANDQGTVYEVTAGGKLTTLYSFCAEKNCADGENPYAGLIQATDGNFYGTTSGGGANDQGTVYEVTAGGELTTLYSFCSEENCADGETPYGGLVQATNGYFYGTTHDGGAEGYGTVFSLSMGLGPFVQTLPTSGMVGTSVIILGNNLTDATSVAFNGTPARFKVASPSEIKTTVPIGATTGRVEVKMFNHTTLTSNLNFRVTLPCATASCIEPLEQ